MEQELKKLGLTPNEIIIYNILLEIGENTVGPLIKKIGMHRQVAYDALKGLEEKNMVISTTKNNRLYFRIANPRNILDNIRQQEATAKNLISEISKKLSGQRKGQEIKIFEGEKAFREMTLRNDNLQPPNTDYLVVSGNLDRFMQIMKVGGYLEKSNRIRKKKNITTKLLYTLQDRQQAERTNRVRANSVIRFIDEAYASPTAFAVWHDSINLISYGSEIFCIEIKNEDFHKTYTNYFKLLWKIAKK